MADKTQKTDSQTTNDSASQPQQGFAGFNGFEWPQVPEAFQKLPELFQAQLAQMQAAQAQMFPKHLMPEGLFPEKLFQMPELPGQEAWTKAMTDHVARVQGWMTELQGASKRQTEQAEKAIDEMARLSKASLNYSLELQTRAHGMFLDQARKAVAAASKPGAVA